MVFSILNSNLFFYGVIILLKKYILLFNFKEFLKRNTFIPYKKYSTFALLSHAFRIVHEVTGIVWYFKKIFSIYYVDQI